MDGNGRWAKARLMPRGYGHNAGMNRMIAMVRHAKELGIRYVTVYALSSENLSRPQEELEGLYNLLRKYFAKNVQELKGEGASVKIIGDISVFPKDVEALLSSAQAECGPAEFTVIFALNYGGRADIVRAVNAAISRGQPVTEQSFARLLYTDGIPDPDLIIRTGREKRLSNFLTYQSAYSELYFTDVLFPDFTEKEFDKAVSDYSQRDRRFGKIQ